VSNNLAKNNNVHLIVAFCLISHCAKCQQIWSCICK